MHLRTLVQGNFFGVECLVEHEAKANHLKEAFKDSQPKQPTTDPSMNNNWNTLHPSTMLSTGKSELYMWNRSEFLRLITPEIYELFKLLVEQRSFSPAKLASEYRDFLSWSEFKEEIKNEIVLRDPTENGIRKALNFGHTLGHAIESYFLADASRDSLLHGEAIAAGMLLESHLSLQLGLIASGEYEEISKRIVSMFGQIEFSGADISEIINLMQYDKKNEFGRILFVLLNGIGNVEIDQTVSNDLIDNAFKAYLS
ncbi:MAG: hypothetical protein EOP04_20575 [Proteobacteria bacterium]|nr:MAG: hypothetical protein EOP04_20575 [Pseudomonadota bacterium]